MNSTRVALAPAGLLRIRESDRINGKAVGLEADCELAAVLLAVAPTVSCAAGAEQALKAPMAKAAPKAAIETDRCIFIRIPFCNPFSNVIQPKRGVDQTPCFVIGLTVANEHSLRCQNGLHGQNTCTTS